MSKYDDFSIEIHYSDKLCAKVCALYGILWT